MARSDEERSQGAGGWRVEGSRTPKPPRLRPSRSKLFWTVLALGLLANRIAYSAATTEEPPPQIPYSAFRAQVGADNETAMSQLGEHRGQLHRLAEGLLEHETLDESEIYRTAGVSRRLVKDLGGLLERRQRSSTATRQRPASSSGGRQPD